MNYETVIKNELKKIAETDSQLKIALEDESKSISACLNYIKSRAKEKANNGCAVISDDVVFGWAIHYYVETDEFLKAEKKVKEKQNEVVKEKEIKEREIKQQQEKEKQLEELSGWF